jgi:hypothetical protein
VIRTNSTIRKSGTFSPAVKAQDMPAVSSALQWTESGSRKQRCYNMAFEATKE